MAKKSAAQIRRLQQRAAARGKTYTPPTITNTTKEEVDKKTTEPTTQQDTDDNDTQRDPRHQAAKKLMMELQAIDQNKELVSKERRSAKKRAQAIAVENANCPLEKLLELVTFHQRKEEQQQQISMESTNKSKKPITLKNKESSSQNHHGPYILFIGQLSYTTTSQSLFDHFQTELGSSVITPQSFRIRLLTHPQTNQSRGMAFVETTSPELLYDCLKLHHTYLDGRRINVERSSGGGKVKSKVMIEQYRTEQQKFINETVHQIIQDYQEKGELEKDELDEGVLKLCQRHSAATVEAALGQYVEARGKHMENPSAYLTHIIGRVAVEGPESFEGTKKGGYEKRKAESGGIGGDKKDNLQTKRFKSDASRGGRGGRGGRGERGGIRNYNKFSMEDVDMSLSDKIDGRNDEKRFSRIFPSMSRGRGRGRGYM